MTEKEKKPLWKKVGLIVAIVGTVHLTHRHHQKKKAQKEVGTVNNEEVPKHYYGHGIYAGRNGCYINWREARQSLHKNK